MRSALILLAALGCSSTQELRVCADPNNLPFSNAKGEGFENRLAELVAHDLHAKVRYTWWPQRRGFIRNTLSKGDCDVVMGVPAHYGPVGSTIPYYRSTYVFLSRHESGLDITSLDDPRLRSLTIGVQLVGDDYTNTPPAHALSRRGLIGNLRGYSLYANYGEPNPPARIVDAVVRKEVDVAMVWGPLAGYFAKNARVPLDVQPTAEQQDGNLPFAFDIAMGVRKDDDSLRFRLNEIITRRRSTIDSLLTAYGVPRAQGGQP
jgi:mxaJ protein